MNPVAVAYAEKSFPAHQLHPVRSVEHRHTGGRTVVASYHSVARAADAAAHLPTRAEWDEIEVLELVGPDAPLTGAVDPEGPAGLTPTRVGISAVGGALLGAVLGAALALIAGAGSVIVVSAAVVGGLLASVVGMAIGGIARYGGERATEQASVPTQGSVAVLTVWTPDDQVASVVAQALSGLEPIEVRVVDDGGHWHSPLID